MLDDFRRMKRRFVERLEEADDLGISIETRIHIYEVIASIDNILFNEDFQMLDRAMKEFYAMQEADDSDEDEDEFDDEEGEDLE